MCEAGDDNHSPLAGTGRQTVTVTVRDSRLFYREVTDRKLPEFTDLYQTERLYLRRDCFISRSATEDNVSPAVHR